MIPTLLKFRFSTFLKYLILYLVMAIFIALVDQVSIALTLLFVFPAMIFIMLTDAIAYLEELLTLLRNQDTNGPKRA